MKYTKTSRYVLRDIGGIYLLIDIESKDLIKKSIPNINDTGKVIINFIDQYDCFDEHMIAKDFIKHLKYANFTSDSQKFSSEITMFLNSLVEIGYLRRAKK